MKNRLKTIPGVIITFERDAGSCVMFRIGFEIGQEADAIRGILEALTFSEEIGIVDPENTECSLEVRKTPDGFRIKRGCHGSYGTWGPATTDEAFNWLLPGAFYAAKNLPVGYGGLLIEHR